MESADGPLSFDYNLSSVFSLYSGKDLDVIGKVHFSRQQQTDQYHHVACTTVPWDCPSNWKPCLFCCHCYCQYWNMTRSTSGFDSKECLQQSEWSSMIKFIISCGLTADDVSMQPSSHNRNVHTSCFVAQSHKQAIWGCSRLISKVEQICLCKGGLQ